MNTGDRPKCAKKMLPSSSVGLLHMKPVRNFSSALNNCSLQPTKNCFFSQIISVIQICKKGKSKLVPVHAIKAYRGCNRLVPLILNHRTRWK